MHVGKTIQRLQRVQGISCLELAKAMKTTPQQLSRWRQSEDVKFSVVIQLSKHLNANLEEFTK